MAKHDSPVTQALGLPFVEWCRTILGVEFTPGQAEIARVLGGGDPEDARIWGFAGPVGPIPRMLFALLFGGMSGKSLIGACYGLWRMMVADLSRARIGAPPRSAVVSTRIDTAKITLRMAQILVEGGPLNDCLIGKPLAETIKILRPHDGREVWFHVIPKSPGGSAAKGFDYTAGFMDEAEFVDPNDPEAAVTDKEIVHGVTRRLMPGSSFVLASTPYNSRAYMAELVRENHGKPTTALAGIAPTLYMRPDDPGVAMQVAAMMAHSPEKALREFECVRGEDEGAFFPPAAVDAAVRGGIVATGQKVSAACDLAFLYDGSALIITERQESSLVVTHVDFVPSPSVPSVVRLRFLTSCKARGAHICAADVHEWSTTAEFFAASGVQLSKAPAAQTRDAAYGLVRRMLRDGTLIIPNDPRLIRQLKSVTGKPTQSGALTISLPRSHGSHADLVSALVAAVWLDRRHGPIGLSLERPSALKSGWTA